MLGSLEAPRRPEARGVFGSMVRVEDLPEAYDTGLTNRTPPGPPVTFEVGGHQVTVEGLVGAWRVSVDGRELPDGYRTRADAWEAGVREVDRLDPQPSG